MTDLLLTAAFSDVTTARELATRLHGSLFYDEREETAHLPFAALVTCATDTLDDLLDNADVGVWLTYNRIIKSRSSEQTKGEQQGAINLFTMVGHPEKTHKESDHYWRDHHAPLALKIHEAMTHYRQFSIVHRFSGPEWDGFALCGFDSLEDLRERFYASKAGELAIAEDVAKFSDGKKSPRRIIAKEVVYAD